MQQRFAQLYRKRLYVHHYSQYMEQSCFEEAHQVVQVRCQSPGYLGVIMSSHCVQEDTCMWSSHAFLLVPSTKAGLQTTPPF